jgi:hypothetical protein
MGLPSQRRMERIMSAPSVQTILYEKGSVPGLGASQAKAVRTEIGTRKGTGAEGAGRRREVPEPRVYGRD